MNNHQKLVLGRLLRAQIRKYEDALKTIEPDGDYCEMIRAEKHDAEQMLVLLERKES